MVYFTGKTVGNLHACQDGFRINILDIVMLASHILEPSLEGCSLETADVNNDGELNVLDIIAIINILLGN